MLSWKVLFGILLMCVFASADPIVNVALQSNGGVATQSSTFLNDEADWGAGYANNGIIEPSALGGGFQHTDGQENAWWEVEFDDVYFVTDATIYNRLDGFGERINPFSVFLYDDVGAVVWSLTGQSIDVGAGETTATFSGINEWGKRFRVQLDGNSWLHMAEVVVNADLGAGQDDTAIPEPTTIALVGGVLILGLVRKSLGASCSRKLA